MISHSLLCRIFGVIEILLGMVALAFGASASYARSANNSLGGVFNPADITTNGPWIAMFVGFAAITLGWRIFKGNWVAALEYLALFLAYDIITNFFPALGLDGKIEPIQIGDVLFYATQLVTTATLFFTRPGQALHKV